MKILSLFKNLIFPDYEQRKTNLPNKMADFELFLRENAESFDIEVILDDRIDEDISDRYKRFCELIEEIDNYFSKLHFKKKRDDIKIGNSTVQKIVWTIKNVPAEEIINFYRHFENLQYSGIFIYVLVKFGKISFYTSYAEISSIYVKDNDSSSISLLKKYNYEGLVIKDVYIEKGRIYYKSPIGERIYVPDG